MANTTIIASRARPSVPSMDEIVARNLFYDHIDNILLSVLFPVPITPPHLCLNIRNRIRASPFPTPRRSANFSPTKRRSSTNSRSPQRLSRTSSASQSRRSKTYRATLPTASQSASISLGTESRPRWRARANMNTSATKRAERW
jgi:hypothetical protein